MSIYFFAPENAIPELGTVDRQILDLLADKKPVERKRLVEIDDTFRRYFQRLEGARFGFWAIDRIHEGGSRKATHYQLNLRHFESIESDSLVRAERCFELKGCSLEQAIKEQRRLPRAAKDFELAAENFAELKGNAQ